MPPFEEGDLALWNDGYVTDVAYTTNFFREITPAWLASTAVSLGHRPPDLAHPFRWAEVGCGNGFTAAVVAAAHPQAEVWAFDFNPAHIETARELASRASLGNVQFLEASFATLAALPDTALPEFDFIVAHGVHSWVSPAHRRQIASIVERRLRPGGLFYTSYNCAVGWGAMIPLRGLMRLVAEAAPGSTDAAVPRIVDLIGTLQEGGAGYFVRNPAIEARLDMLRRLDRRYIVHEYLNEHWYPLMFADVADEMSEAKCAFIGSATLPDNIDHASVPPGLLSMFREIADTRMKETVRDFASAQSFRRDIFRKGTTGLSTGEHLELLEKLTLIGLGQRPPAGEAPVFDCTVGTLTGAREAYDPLLDILAVRPLTFGEARATRGLADKSLNEVLQAFALLTAGTFAHPALPGDASPAAVAACRRLNLAIAGINGNGASISNLASPVMGSAITASVTETLVVGALLEGCPATPPALADRLGAVLARTGRRVQRDGKPVTDPDEMRRSMIADAEGVIGARADLFANLGILPRGGQALAT